ncbi:oxygen-dependent FAD-linked oxidoreductase family protein [Abortiporus biennis]
MYSSAFHSTFSGDIVTPSDPSYKDSCARWAANASRPAKMIAYAKTPEDVALAIKYAKATGLRIAVHGGGHSAAGASSSEGGLVIDLSRYLNTVSIDPDKKVAYVGGGATWKSVDYAAIEHGLATVAGTVNHTGVGGLAVGGGFGWLSGAHGLVIDNLMQATVVTADGSIRIASETNNPDLFYGIRGGGSNFGVVTEFVLKLHPQRRTVFAGITIFLPEKCTEIANLFDEWYPNIKENEAVFAAMSQTPDGMPCIILLFFFNGSEADGRENFKKFFELGPIVDGCKERPYEECNELLLSIATPGKNYYMKGGVLSPTPSLDFNMTKMNRVTEFFKAGHHNYVTFIHEYIPLQKIKSVSSSATPYPRECNGNAVIVIQWDNDTPEKTAAAREFSHELIKMLPEGEGYSNYSPDSDTLPKAGSVAPNKSRAMFGEHYDRLQSVKREYDPGMVFNKWFAIAPAAA